MQWFEQEDQLRWEIPPTEFKDTEGAWLIKGLVLHHDIGRILLIE